MTATADQAAGTAAAHGPTGGNRFVGQRVQRREDARLVTGHGTYVDDVVVPGMLHVAFVRSDIACGTITTLDASAARELPGVVAVFTGADLNGDVQEAWVDFEGGDGGRPFRVLADGDVRFAGEPVALVVAESRYIAEDACDLVEIDIDPLDAIIGHDSALAEGPVPCTPSAPTTSPAPSRAADDPELDQIFADAAHVVTETFHQHRYVCVPMECRGVVSIWDGFRNELVVHTSTQGAHGVRGFLSRALGLPENRVRVVMQDVGGGFGQKMFMLPDEVAVVLAGKRLGPAGEVDRGPPREPDGRPARPRRPHDGELRARRGGPHPRRARRTGGGRRIVPGSRQQFDRLRRAAVHRSVQDPQDRVLGDRGATPTRAGGARTAARG